MPSLKWNKNTWEVDYNWQQKGEEWSAPWGNSQAQWNGCLYPRFYWILPCPNILEIACGYGRWTQYLKNYASNKYRGVDLSAKCIEFCKNEFNDEKISFFMNDGTSLEDVSDITYDFVFSFDSLVHVNIDVLNTYIKKILTLLTPGGVCFLHHSNLGSLIKSGKVSIKNEETFHCRDQETSADKVREIVNIHGGKIITQEIIDWGLESLDCLTTFCNKDSFAQIEENQIVNNQFMLEANIIQKIHSKYIKFAVQKDAASKEI